MCVCYIGRLVSESDDGTVTDFIFIRDAERVLGVVELGMAM